MTVLYLAGGMRSYHDFNRPAFAEHARELREAGYQVFNPGEHDLHFKDLHDREPTIREALAVDCLFICKKAEGVALMNGWAQSKGARAEKALAEALGIPALHVDDWLAEAREGVSA